jgi:glycerophosphoryl diester phosphodiesterase
VQRTSDGQAMVFHDWDLDRLTDAAGAIIDHSSTQLGAIALSGAEGIPLRQMLDLVAGRAPLLIEIKSRRDLRVAPLCLAVRRVLEGYRGDVAVMSFDPRVPAWFRRYSPHIVHGLVVTEEGRRTLFARAAASGAVARQAAVPCLRRARSAQPSPRSSAAGVCRC